MGIHRHMFTSLFSKLMWQFKGNEKGRRIIQRLLGFLEYLTSIIFSVLSAYSHSGALVLYHLGFGDHFVNLQKLQQACQTRSHQVARLLWVWHAGARQCLFLYLVEYLHIASEGLYLPSPLPQDPQISN